MIEHHPHEELLLSYVSGRLASAPQLVVGTHLELCAECRHRVRLMEQVGGALLEDTPPAAMSADTLACALRDIERPAALPRIARQDTQPPVLPGGVSWPKSLSRCRCSAWRWLGPGMRWSRLTLPWDEDANVFLLHIGAGKGLAWHTHSERELTLVLHGTFSDGRSRLGPGDFDEASPTVHHQPVVDAGSDCICLASVEGQVVFDHWLARRWGAMVGM